MSRKTKKQSKSDASLSYVIQLAAESGEKVIHRSPELDIANLFFKRAVFRVKEADTYARIGVHLNQATIDLKSGGRMMFCCLVPENLGVDWILFEPSEPDP